MSALPASPYGSPPVYLPFSAVEGPLEQVPSSFVSTIGFRWPSMPFAPVVDAGWNEALHAVLPISATPYSELVDYAMPMGIADMVIPFKVEKVSPVILLSGPMILNTVDSVPLTGLSFTVLNVSTSLLVIQLNALLDSSNYRFRALATVVG